MIRDDFNLTRFAEDKSSKQIDHRWVDKFNDWIDKWGLLELNVTNRAFTWTNKQGNPIMIKIDRVFVTTEWDRAYPLSRIKANPREGSDHTPLIVNTGNNTFFGKKDLGLRNGG